MSSSSSPSPIALGPLIDIKKDKWDLKHIFEEELKLKDREILGLKRQLRDQRMEINMLRKRLEGSLNNGEGRTAKVSTATLRNCRKCVENKGVVAEKESLIKDLVLRLQKTEDTSTKRKAYKPPEERLPSSGGSSDSYPSPPDLDALIPKIVELNTLVLEVGSEVSKQSRRASFKKKDSVTLDFYSNGFRLGRRGESRLRLYEEPSSQRFFSDISDGFFPSELQGEYPKGVAFLVNDSRTEEWTSTESSMDFVPFSGGGRKLGNLKSPKKERLPLISRRRTSRTPKTPRRERSASGRKCQIKVIHGHSRRASLLCLSESDTIEGLKRLLSEDLKSESDFHLYSPFPRARVDSWGGASLSELGLCPNYVLHAVEQRYIPL